MASLELRRGDDTSIRGEVMRRENGVPVPVDITNWTIWFTVKRRWPDSDGDAVFSKVSPGGGIGISDGPGGEFVVTINANDFLTVPVAERTILQYDVQVKTAPTNGIKTLGQGPLVILGEITQATS